MSTNNYYKPKKCGYCKKTFTPKQSAQIYCNTKCFQAQKKLGKLPSLQYYYQTGQGIISPKTIDQWLKTV